MTVLDPSARHTCSDSREHLIIRTGGDSRASGFFPRQSSAAELFVASWPWPAFTEGDLEDALAHYAKKRPAVSIGP